VVALFVRPHTCVSRKAAPSARPHTCVSHRAAPSARPTHVREQRHIWRMKSSDVCERSETQLLITLQLAYLVVDPGFVSVSVDLEENDLLNQDPQGQVKQLNGGGVSDLGDGLDFVAGEVQKEDRGRGRDAEVHADDANVLVVEGHLDLHGSKVEEDQGEGEGNEEEGQHLRGCLGKERQSYRKDYRLWSPVDERRHLRREVRVK